MAKREANLELGSGDVAGAAGVDAVEPLPENHRVLHLLPPAWGTRDREDDDDDDRGYAPMLKLGDGDIARGR